MFSSRHGPYLKKTEISDISEQDVNVNLIRYVDVNVIYTSNGVPGEPEKCSHF